MTVELPSSNPSTSSRSMMLNQEAHPNIPGSENYWLVETGFVPGLLASDFGSTVDAHTMVYPPGTGLGEKLDTVFEVVAGTQMGVAVLKMHIATVRYIAVSKALRLLVHIDTALGLQVDVLLVAQRNKHRML